MGAPNNLIRVPRGGGKCSWCGQSRKTLYGYASDSSGGWRTKDATLFARGGRGFCGTSCFRAFNDMPRSGYDYVDRTSHRDNPSRRKNAGRSNTPWALKFKDLRVGDRFEFSSKMEPLSSGIMSGPWQKIGPLHYRLIDDPGGRHSRIRVGTKNVEVYRETRSNPPSGKAGDYLAESLHPKRFTDMSPKMAAILGYILDKDWASPKVTSAVVTSDGYVMIWTKDRPHKEGLFSTLSDLRRNLSNLASAAELSAAERQTLESLFREKFPRA